MTKRNNLLLNQINYEEDGFKIEEVIPDFSSSKAEFFALTFDGSVQWAGINGSNNISISRNSSGEIIIDAKIPDPFEGTQMHFKDGQVGIGGIPIHTYKVDIRVPLNTRTTALHIGDGRHGFSMGNATNEGFLPQLIGLGSSADDAGFYILGKTSVDSNSGTPAIIIDGRHIDNSPLSNRPILGISSGSYRDFKLLIDANGNVGIGRIPEIYKLEIEGDLKAKNIIFDSSTGTTNLRKEIEDLKMRIKELEAK